MTNTITLYNTPTGWIADMSQSAEAADILDLFHTYHLPLPFTSAADARAVLAATIKLNPTARSESTRLNSSHIQKSRMPSSA